MTRFTDRHSPIARTLGMVMQGKKIGQSIPYAFCDIYRFAGDKVAELTAFVIRTDKANTGDRTPTEARSMATRQG